MTDPAPIFPCVRCGEHDEYRLGLCVKCASGWHSFDQSSTFVSTDPIEAMKDAKWLANVGVALFWHNYYQSQAQLLRVRLARQVESQQYDDLAALEPAIEAYYWDRHLKQYAHPLDKYRMDVDQDAFSGVSHVSPKRFNVIYPYAEPNALLAEFPTLYALWREVDGLGMIYFRPTAGGMFKLAPLWIREEVKHE